ncbi:hypothetical protein [Microvirga sp. P5_D2]|jgi:hypothetical protein
MGVRIRAHDWATTPLGQPEGWSQALKTLVSVMLGSIQPMFIVWGPERILLYNNGYAEIQARQGALLCALTSEPTPGMICKCAYFASWDHSLRRENALWHTVQPSCRSRPPFRPIS